MKSLFSRKAIITGLFAVMFLVFGFQTEAGAQITVINNTNCFIAFEVYEGKCDDACDSQGTQLAPGAQITYNLSSCFIGSDWFAARYLASPGIIGMNVASQGRTINPVFNCEPDVSAPCNGNIQGNWFTFGTNTRLIFSY